MKIEAPIDGLLVEMHCPKQRRPVETRTNDHELVVLNQQSGASGAMLENPLSDMDKQLTLNVDNAAHTSRDLQADLPVLIRRSLKLHKPVPLSGSVGAEAVPVDDASKSHPPVRSCFTQAGVGQHSNPYHLPRSVTREGVTAKVIDLQILNAVLPYSY